MATLKTEEEIQALTDEINALRKECHEGHDSLPAGVLRSKQARVNELQNQRERDIAAGCSPCPSCKQQPIGMHQVAALNHTEIAGFDIGCRDCLDHRAFGMDLRSAREAWERGPGHPRGWRRPNPKRGRRLHRTAEGIVSTLADGSTINWGAKMEPHERKAHLKRAQAVSPTLAPATGEAKTIA